MKETGSWRERQDIRKRVRDWKAIPGSENDIPKATETGVAMGLSRNTHFTRCDFKTRGPRGPPHALECQHHLMPPTFSEHLHGSCEMHIRCSLLLHIKEMTLLCVFTEAPSGDILSHGSSGGSQLCPFVSNLRGLCRKANCQ